MTRQIKASKKFRIYRRVHNELFRCYPAVFPKKGRRLPLATGIFQAIAADSQIGASRSDLRIFLRIWSSSTSYLKTLRREKARYGLDGSTVSKVSEREQLEAANRLQSRAQTRR